MKKKLQRESQKLDLQMQEAENLRLATVESALQAERDRLLKDQEMQRKLLSEKLEEQQKQLKVERDKMASQARAHDQYVRRLREEAEAKEKELAAKLQVSWFRR